MSQVENGQVSPSISSMERIARLRPGGRSGKHPYAHPSEEVAFVAQGEVRLTLGPEEHRLRRGDAATILAGELRLWRNCTRARGSRRSPVGPRR